MKLPRHVALATLHGKAAAISPPLRLIGVEIVTAPVDTDRFGTFSGEVPRPGTMEFAARAKALAAIAETGLPVGLASEGAYGPHPVVPFLAQGRELLLWHEAETGREIVEWRRDDRPSYDSTVVSDLPEAVAFMDRIDWPGAALVVSPFGLPRAVTAKGIVDRVTLAAAVEQALDASPQRKAILSVDMRAHLNPRRMAVIGELAQQLASRLSTLCPNCKAGGWGLVRQEIGLPCAECGTATGLVRYRVTGCTSCGTEEMLPPIDGRTVADCAYCPICNP